MFVDGTLKIIRFSDFQMDEITGDCFGEIRLALLKKGDEIIPLTGGSVTINNNAVVLVFTFWGWYLRTVSLFSLFNV